MKKLTLLFFVFHFSFFTFHLSEAQVIHVPADYPTIQQGIDASVNGDTVLVDPGTYMENINFNGKKITVASLFLITQDKAYMSLTVINGGASGPVVSFYYGEDAGTLLCGFTLTNGYNWGGGGIYCESSSPVIRDVIITGNNADSGGGIFMNYCNPQLVNVVINNNSAISQGGGMCCYSSNPGLENVTIKFNSSTSGGGIYSSYAMPVFDSLNRCNIYLNSASYGMDLSADFYQEAIEVVVDTFTVMNPTVYYASPLDKFTFDILNGKIQQVSADLYVSPGGDDANSGLTPDEPLKTINYAFQVILADSLNPHTVRLLEGTYSPASNGEQFPVRVPEYVTLAGVAERGVILDAEETSYVFEIFERQHVAITDLTVTGGSANNYGGGGIYCSASSPVLQNLLIINNSSAYYGGGIYCGYDSHPELQNVTITNNSAVYSGGGMYVTGSGWGSPPGMPVFDSLNRCNIYLNNAPDGCDLYSENMIEVIVDTFTVLNPRSAHASPLVNFSFDILHGLIPQENIDLYVSPGGDNANSGLTIDDPLKTVHFADSVITEDKLNIYSLHLSNGLYSPSSNGESFPLVFPECLKVKGESESGVILDAEGQSGVLRLYNTPFLEISDMTIKGGNSADYGGGIYCNSSNPDLRNLTITNNISGSYGGGIYCGNSNPRFENLTIKNNYATLNGGGIYFDYNSKPVFDTINRCNIYLNSASLGNDLFYYYGIRQEVILDTFTVLYPRSKYAYPLSNFSFDILRGMIPQENIDLFVSPEGDNSNSGLTADDPLKTAHFALSVVGQDSLNLYGITLLDGVYSPSSTGEAFPLVLPEFTVLSGESQAGTILDAEGLTGVIQINSVLSVKVSDLTITGGNSAYGGGIYCIGSNTDFKNLTITGNSGTTSGGGIYSGNYCEPSLQDLTITNNTAGIGGGIAFYSQVNAGMKHVTVSNNSAEKGGGIYCYDSKPVFDSLDRCNIYFNHASSGNDLYSEYAPAEIDVITDTFTVLVPTGFHALPLESFSFDILNGKMLQYEADLFVSPDGDNANTGLTADDPLKTVYSAYTKMLADSLHPHTVNLLAGTYSPSTTGENFPITTLDYISLTGESESSVILDAEGLSRVITVTSTRVAAISDLTITGGLTSDNGGGIYCDNSGLNLYNVNVKSNSGYAGGGIYLSGSNSMDLQNVSISDNSATNSGGGLFSQSGSGLVLKQVSLTNNTASEGGGVYLNQSSPEMQDVILSNNSADNGGGIFCAYSSYPIMHGVKIINNSADINGGGICTAGGGWGGDPGIPVFDSLDRCNIYLNNAQKGGDLYAAAFTKVVVDTFTVMYPNEYHAFPIENFSFDILNGKLEQVDADLYVSPSGSNANSGFSEDAPLKNLHYAFMKIIADSQHSNAIRLADGTYNSSANGDIFPVIIPDYVRLEGASESGVILDAEGQSGVFDLIDNQNVVISNMTVTGGHSTGSGGGINAWNSNPYLQNLTISDNSADVSGGGVLCSGGSGFTLKNTRIINNSAYQGGGVTFYDSSPDLQDVIISGNASEENGGGIYCSNSSPVLQHADISNNTAVNGGGIFNFYGSNPVLKDVTISYNSAQDKGGGIFFADAGVNFDSTNRCNIYFNNANQGDDLYSSLMTTVVVDTFTVLYPKFYQAYPLDNFNFNILHGKVSQVNADLYVSAGGNDSNSGLTNDDPLKTIRTASTMMLEDSLDPKVIHLMNGTYSLPTNGELFPLYIPRYSSIEGESESGVIIDAGGQGRVFEVIEDQVTGLSDMTITGGHASKGGGALSCKNAGLDLQNVTLRNNTSIQHGGAIYFDNSTGNWNNVTFESNTANLSGGGIFCFHSDPVMNNVLIINDSAGFDGGGMICSNKSNPVFGHVTISNNKANKNGGGLYFNSSDPVLKDVTISFNAAAQKGGGICVSSSNPVMQDVKILDNSAEIGGGISYSGAAATLLNSSVSNNSASMWGGGIYSASSQLDFVNVSMADNMATDGGGIYCSNSDLLIRNSILWNVSAYEIFFRPVFNESSVSMSYSDIKGGESGIMTSDNGTVSLLEGNINGEPLFTGNGYNPYSLSADSPCRDAGTPDTTGLYLPLNDLAGNPRIWDGRVDMGAYEWNNVGVPEEDGSRQSAFSSFPNPFSSVTTIEYELEEAGPVILKVFNNTGQEVATLVNELQSKGKHQTRWDAEGMPAGLYFIQKCEMGNRKSEMSKLVKF